MSCRQEDSGLVPASHHDPAERLGRRCALSGPHVPVLDLPRPLVTVVGAAL